MRLLGLDQRPLLILLALPVCFAILAASDGASSQILLVLSDSLSILLASTATVLSHRTARALSGRARRSWFVLTLGLALWAAGEVVWSYYEVVLAVDAPFPSAADILYLGAYPVIFAGILMLSAPTRGTARLRTLLDAGVVVLALATPLWVYLLEPIYSMSDSGWVEKTMTAAYPVGDLIVVFALAVAALRAGPGRRGIVLGFLGGGLLAFVATDIFFAIGSLENEFATGSVLDAGWFLGYALIAVAAFYEAQWQSTSGETKDDAQLASARQQLVPMVLLLALLTWFSYQTVWGSGVDGVTAACIMLASMLVIFRSFLSLSDVLTVTAQLHATSKLLEEANEGLRDKSRILNALLTEAVDLSRRDSLTGLLNHVAILEELEIVLARQHPVLVAMLDVDFMKNINDTMGHPAGDDTLKALAASLKRLEGVTAGRYGGDEFMAFASLDSVQVEDFKRLAAAQIEAIRVERDVPIEARVSFGWASSPLDGTTSTELIQMADTRLYEAKRLRDFRPTVPRDSAA